MKNSLIGRPGGKRQLRNEVIRLMPGHHTFAEVFCGACWVLLGKDPSRREFINDADGELVNFWRVIKQRPERFVEEMKYLFDSREIFKIMKNADACYLSEVVRAVRFYYLNKTSFGAMGTSHNLGASGLKRLNFKTMQERIDEIWQRLRDVTILNMDFRRCIERLDGKNTLFYLDPPYYGIHGLYKHDLTAEDHVALADCLKNIKGKFILSYNDCGFVRKFYKGFMTKKVSATYSIRTSGRKVGELLIINFKHGKA